MLNKFRKPEILLLLLAMAVPLSFATWSTLLNNFAIEKAAFTGAEIGILQSLREIPGFLAFGVVYLLLFIREQRLAYVSLILLGLGTLITGWFPTVFGLYITTIIMSIGFHYYETLQTSLTLQWVDKKDAPYIMGKMISIASFTSIVIFGLIWLTRSVLNLDFAWIYALGGGLTVLIAAACWLLYPVYPEKVIQHKKVVLRKRYWMYYALTFMSGARRQIFMVFAGFLMVEKFGYSVQSIALLFLANATLNMFIAPLIGKLIGKIGERKALIFEYIGLFFVFTAYAFVDDHRIAAGLYLIDHLFFAMAIAIKTYFQKIADPKDISATAAVGFTINHIAAVFLPVVLGFLWLDSPSMVFLCGSVMAVVSLLLSLNIPSSPQPGNEVIVGHKGNNTIQAGALN